YKPLNSLHHPPPFIRSLFHRSESSFIMDVPRPSKLYHNLPRIITHIPDSNSTSYRPHPFPSSPSSAHPINPTFYPVHSTPTSLSSMSAISRTTTVGMSASSKRAKEE
ncbi:hypothetical protein BX616_004511, partial [Lobosporangium transversale]